MDNNEECQKSKIDILLDHYKRNPDTVYPKTYATFKGRKEINSKLPTFIVQDLTEDLIEDCAKIMMKYFVNEEPAHKYTSFSEDFISMAEEEELLKYSLCQKMGLVCLVENETDEDGKPVIAGINATCLKYQENEDEKIMPQGEKINELRLCLEWIENNIEEPCKFLNITEYLGSLGLYVLEQYRGQGIGEALINARIPLCKTLGLKFTVSNFTSNFSQKIAEKCKYKDMVKIKYEELLTRDPSLFKYPEICNHSEYFTVKYLKIE